MHRRWFVGLTVVVLVLSVGAVVPVLGAGAGQQTEVSGDQTAAVTGGQPTPSSVERTQADVGRTTQTDAGRTTRPDTHELSQLGTPEGFNSTVFVVTLYENSSAKWTVRHRRPLDNEEEREQFESFAAEFNSTETQTYRDFQSRARALTDFASNATGREMRATNFRKNAEVRERFRPLGVMEMSFVWTNFSRTTDRGIVVDDVFEGGMYIGSGQRLVMVRGEGLVFESVDPDPDEMGADGNLTASQNVTWTGERNFADERPKLVVVRPDALSEQPDSEQTPSGAEVGSLGPLSIAVVVLMLLLLGGALAWYFGGLDDIVGGDSGDGATATESVATADQAASAEPEPAVPEEELLSDEDRVLKLLEENGGRMKQVNIVEETEWSKSKVSMLLSDMEEEGLISKLRVGRENIISKAGEEPDAVGSPFEDE